MKLDRIALRQVRNLACAELAPHGGLNLLVGPNAAGKSNFCEALYYAAQGWLLKGERQRDLIAWDQSEALLEFLCNGTQARIHLNGSAKTKTIELNREKKTQSALSATFRALLFTPDELQIIKGSPEQRRRFLDRSISDLSCDYRHVLREYEQVLRRKSAVLRSGRPDLELLDVFDEELCVRGAYLIKNRCAYAQKINETLSQHYQQIAGQTAQQLVLHYETALTEDPQQALAQLLTMRSEELRRGQALVGPQRDDLRFALNEHDLKRYGSQGEQKSALCAVLLAQLELQRERFGDYPVLILDDVLSELDRGRTQRLLQLLHRDLQIFLTHTVVAAEEIPDELRQAARRVFAISDGQICELP